MESQSSGSSFSNSSGGSQYSPWAQGWANKVMPGLSDAFGKMAGSSYGGDYAQFGFTPTNFGPSQIWNPQQIQERVNLGRSQNDVGMGAYGRDLANRMAGTGYGTNSPSYLEQMTNAFGRNMAANTETENNLRWQAAQGNAQFGLERAKAASDERLRQQQLAAQMYGQQISQLGPLAHGLYQFAQPLPFSKSQGGSGQMSQSGSGGSMALGNWGPYGYGAFSPSGGGGGFSDSSGIGYGDMRIG